MTVSRRDGIARSHQSGKGKRPRRNMKDSFQQAGPLRLSRCTAAGPASIIAFSFSLLTITNSEQLPSLAATHDDATTAVSNIRHRLCYAA